MSAKKQATAAPTEASELTKFQRARLRDQEWEKDDIFEVVYWFRQILSVIIGVIWGIIPLQGIVGIGSFGIVQVFVAWLYYARFLNWDEEPIHRTDLVKEGFFPAFALFLLTWIAVFSTLYA
eukprot:TRINITY_DN14273_c0_g1_i1.p1 TRINITY_DN14273_c0_g1~~TRINITY_DN14273_c0_g1_i1.p1  ORF type:complete len:136 (+),score=23.47 TRINITY_DN14273_c0_g1_i1:43-408(+)